MYYTYQVNITFDFSIKENDSENIFLLNLKLLSSVCKIDKHILLSIILANETKTSKKIFKEKRRTNKYFLMFREKLSGALLATYVFLNLLNSCIVYNIALSQHCFM